MRLGNPNIPLPGKVVGESGHSYVKGGSWFCALFTDALDMASLWRAGDSAAMNALVATNRCYWSDEAIFVRGTVINKYEGRFAEEYLAEIRMTTKGESVDYWVSRWKVFYR